MFHLTALVSCLAVQFWLVQMSSTKDWRGLVPMKSTLSDVERVMGLPRDNFEKQLLSYYLPNETVFFSFSGNPACQKKVPYSSWNVTENTLTGIRVGLKQPITVSDAGIDLAKLRKIRGDHDLPDRFYYRDDKSGFAVEVSRDRIVAYQYEPDSDGMKLLCPASEIH